MGIKKAYNNFTGGEISPTLSGRSEQVLALCPAHGELPARTAW